MTAPERYLCWRWEDESEATKMTYTPDSKRPNAGTFVLGKEDHTLGNLIRIQMLRNPNVRFAAYRMPHPLIFDCHIRVETMDSRSTPLGVFEAAVSDLQNETNHLEQKWENAVKEFERSQGI